MMRKMKYFSLLLLSSLLFISCGGSSKQEISIAYVNWAEGVAMTHLAKEILEDQGYRVKLKNADVAPVFAALAKKDADLFLDSWLPITHADYMEKYGDKLDILGDLYTEANIGLVVPSYVDINSIEELSSHKDKFDGKIVGIDAGAGVMAVTEQAIADYNLGFELLSSTGPMMAASLQKAIDKKEWIVVTGWRPHWKFSRFDLKFLEDSKKVYGEAEVIKSIARKGFKEEHPFVAELISNMQFSNEEISSLMNEVENAATESIGVKKWIKTHEELVKTWIPKSLNKEMD